MTREELINTYIKIMKSESKSEGTIKEYLKHINEYFSFLDNNGIDYKEVKPKDIKLFRNENLNLSTSSKNGKVSAVNSFYTFLVDDMEMMDYNPCSSVKSLKIKDRAEKVPLTKIQIHWLINACKNDRDRAIITMLVNTGLRISELINVTLKDYEYAKSHDGELSILGKGNKLRIVYLNDKVFEMVDKYLLVRKESEYDNLFISNGCIPMDRSCISRTLKTTAKRSGHFNDDEISRIHNHLLRHSHFTNLSDNGIPLEVISELAGHSNVNTSKIYVHVSKNRAKEAVQNFSI